MSSSKKSNPGGSTQKIGDKTPPVATPDSLKQGGGQTGKSVEQTSMGK